MRRRFGGLALLLVALTTVACGYFQAGSWEDDDKNWYRAFGEAKPPEVVLTHSLYERYPHWTHEHSFYLEFQTNREFLEKMISRFRLTPTGSRSRALLIGEGPGIPSWFAPEPMDSYDVWKGTGSLESAVLFVQGTTGVAYFTHTQL